MTNLLLQLSEGWQKYFPV